MGYVSTGSTAIPFGANLRIGYKVYGNLATSYTYLGYFPSYNELPYIFALPTGKYQIEYATLCPTCTLPAASGTATTVVTVA